MLNPLLLLFLPIALVPILLHLITLRRLRTVELSTFRFLMESYVQQRRKVKLLEFLLMLLRTAFVAMIVLALSRPVVERFRWLTPGNTGRDVTIIMDAGVSMGLRTGGTTSLERASGTARAIVNLLGSADRVTVIRAGSKPQVLLSRFAGEPDPILARINELRTDIASSNMPAALEMALTADRQGRRIVYVITDFSRGSWGGLKDHPALATLDQTTQLVLMDVGSTTPVVNAAVVGDPPQVVNQIAGLPVMLSATIVNGSAEKSIDTVLSVILDDEQVARFNVSLQPGQRVTRPIPVTPSRAGAIRGRFELPADAFPDDDSYLFCLNVEPSLDVLIVAPPGSATGQSDDELYLRAALTSALHARGTATTEEKQIAASLRITTIKPDQLTAMALAESHVVILADVPMTQAIGAMLGSYVQDGGGMLIFPGPHVRGEYYQAHLLRMPGATSAGDAAVLIQPPVGNPDNEAEFRHITGVDLTHPVLNVFAEKDARYFSTVRIFRHFPLKLPTGAEAEETPATAPSPDHPPVLTPPQNALARILMRLPDRSPAMIERQIGKGRVIIAGFPATPQWSNLPLKPEFVPLMLRAVAHVRRPAYAYAPSTVNPNEPATLTLTDRWPQAQIEATGPTGGTRMLDLHRSGTQFLAAMLDTAAKGYYGVKISPRAEGAPQTLDLGFAVNVANRDASLSSYDREAFAKLIGPVNYVHLKGTADDPILADQLTQRKEIWRTLIWAMFAVIALEFLLSTLSPGKPREVDGERKPPLLRRIGSWLMPFHVPSPARRVGKQVMEDSHAS